MSVVVLRLAALLYACGAAAYVTFFARPRHARLATLGFWLVAAAFAVHAAAIGLACKEFAGAEFFTLRGGLVMIAWLVAGAFLLLQRFYELPTVGAFITPLVVLAVIPALFGAPGRMGAVPEAVRQKWLPIHVSTALGGVAFFALAFGVALMYLLQEREVKGKHFGALFSRLPPLDALDRMVQRLVRMGFVVFSVALVTGALVAKKAWGSFWEWDPQQVTSLAIWLLYGVMVQLRHAGVHGRRYALLTVLGFCLVMTSMLGLDLLASGSTRHGGSYQ